MAAMHGLSPLGGVGDIKNAIVDHIAYGECAQLQLRIPPACANFRQECPLQLTKPLKDQNKLCIFFLSQLVNKIHWQPLCWLLETYDIVHDYNGMLNILCCTLKAYIGQLYKGKCRSEKCSQTDSNDFLNRCRSRNI